MKSQQAQNLTVQFELMDDLQQFFSQICFWLLDNGFRVMIAACDTFRAGAVEQLRTHVRHLNALHPPAGGSGPPSVLLYEKGYGKDAASIAMDAINFGELA